MFVRPCVLERRVADEGGLHAMPRRAGQGR